MDVWREWKEAGQKEREREGERNIDESGVHGSAASCMCPIRPDQTQGWKLSHTGQGIV